MYRAREKIKKEENWKTAPKWLRSGWCTKGRLRESLKLLQMLFFPFPFFLEAGNRYRQAQIEASGTRSSVMEPQAAFALNLLLFFQPRNTSGMEFGLVIVSRGVISGSA